MNESMHWTTRMNATDALFWQMDLIPELRSTVGAIVLLERLPRRERIRDTFERVTSELVRMRQRVVEVPWNLAPPEWVDDDQFDLDYHLRSLAVPAPGGMEELLAEISPLYATPLDRNRPLWEAYVAEGLLGGRGAIFVKMHHCLTDGVGGTRLFEALLGNKQEPDLPPIRAQLIEPRSTSLGAMLWRAQLHNAGEAVRTAGSLARTLGEAALNPPATLTSVWQGARTLLGFGSELLKVPARSPLHDRRSLSRRLATFEMPLAEVELACKRLGATHNDIMLTIVSGAMHRWHTSRGADVKMLRATVPVNLRAATEDAAAGNRIALLALSLPVGEPDALERLRVIQERMGRVKSDRRATVYPLLARAMTLMPTAISTALARQQTSRTNFVCTNVPGPSKTCYLAGESIEGIYAYAPLVGDHPVAIALFTYRGTIFGGLDVDPMAMHDLPHFVDALRESSDEVLGMGRHRQVAAAPVRRQA